MGANNGYKSIVNHDHFVTVLKENKKNPDVVIVNASELARRLRRAWEKELKDFLNAEKINESGMGIFVGLKMPKDYEIRNILLEYFKKLNEGRISELKQTQNQKIKKLVKELGIEVEETEKPRGVCMME